MNGIGFKCHANRLERNAVSSISDRHPVLKPKFCGAGEATLQPQAVPDTGAPARDFRPNLRGGWQGLCCASAVPGWAAFPGAHTSPSLPVFLKQANQPCHGSFRLHGGEVAFAGRDAVVTFPAAIMKAVPCNLLMVGLVFFFCTDKPLSPKALKGLESTQLTKNYYPVVSFKVLIVHFNK